MRIKNGSCGGGGRLEEDLKRDLCRIILGTLAVAVYFLGWDQSREPGNPSNLELGVDQSTNLVVLLMGLTLSVMADGIGSDPRVSRELILARFFKKLCVFLVGASLVGNCGSYIYRYHGAVRWSGPWVNPNTSGVLMAVGVIIAVGEGIYIFSLRTEQQKLMRTAQVRAGLMFAICLICCTFGLMKSYSRGAWLATCAGLLFIGWKQCDSRLRKSAVLLLLICSCTLVSIFWQYRNTDSRYAGRVFSAFNINDFSWRNRVDAWARMTTLFIDHPGLGVGWNNVETEPIWNTGPDGALAAQLNDYLTLAVSMGLFGFLSFLAYVCFSLRSVKPKSTSTRAVIAQAASVVLMVAFWFDGGLFKLAISGLYWVLMSFSTSERQDYPQQSCNPLKIQRFLRVAEPILVIFLILSSSVALAQTGLHLLVPKFRINEGILKIARHSFVQPELLPDFNYLIDRIQGDPQRLEDVLDYLALADYNRHLIPWSPPKDVYRNFILSPDGAWTLNCGLRWRRQLWESLYPWVRKERDLNSAALIVEQRLRNSQNPIRSALKTNGAERSLDSKPNESVFQVLYVAGLKAVGIPARLDLQNKAEVWQAGTWYPAAELTVAHTAASYLPK